ncbi:Porphobilinogen deaminase [hydrothermal vent metagenome]|uniref:uroporphyrinogen-III C-methyltransferase n=1 Tax=hydrothermal vent metagenome TaxID=652676 RepID=A0A3B1DEU9_9ZZZZ
MTHNQNTIRVGSRGSKLALVQIDEIKDLLKVQGLTPNFDQKVFITKGDKDKTISLTDASVSDDFFTDTLDKAILNNEIDIAIHSAKDLPQHMHKDLRIFALTKSMDETDAFVGNIHFKDLPKGAKIGTSSLIRLEALKSLNSNIELIDIRGTIEERIKQMQEGKYDGVIIATIALKRLGLKQHIKDIMPWEASPLQGQLAIVGRKKNIKLHELFANIDIRKTYGKVILVGAGPGDPDLFTQKGIKALQKADCVFYDFLVTKDLLEHAPEAEKIPAGKRKGAHSMPQAEINQNLRKAAQKGKGVVRLKGGDPFIFGRGSEEMQYLQSYHIPVEIIPGISSTTAIPALLGIPLTDRRLSSSVAFISAHRQKDCDSEHIEIPNTDTIVFLMGLTKLKEIVSTLRQFKKPPETPMVVISKGSRKEEKVVYGTLADIEQKVLNAKLEAPALIITGKTVAYGYSLHRN